VVVSYHHRINKEVLMTITVTNVKVKDAKKTLDDICAGEVPHPGYSEVQALWKNQYKKSRVYFFPKGENILENLKNRHFRPWKAYKEAIGPVLEKMGLPSDTKVRWSQKAGCPCGCSPGFVVDTDHGKEVFVDIE